MSGRTLPGGAVAWWSGLRAALGNARLLLWLLAANLVMAVVAVWPLLGPFEGSLAHHPASEQLTRRFDMPWWVDLTTSQADAFARTVELIGLVGFLAALLGCFFSGGLLQAYRDTLEGRSMDRFMTSCRLWFARFAWLFVLSLPLYWFVHRMVNTHLELALRDLLERVTDERVGLLLTLGRAVLFLVLFDLVTLAVDYARVHAIVRTERSMLAALRAGLWFVLLHPVKVWTLEIWTVLLQCLALMIYLPVDGLIGRNSVPGLLLGLFAAQSFLLLRLFLRETSHAGQVALYAAGPIDSSLQKPW
ncbi:MAG: hypothetical protein ACE5HU_06910 [Acidobacteriota bacterium]